MSCIEFSGCRNKAGYGRQRVGKGMQYAHRVAYAKDRGVSISDLKGMCVCHTCDNPPCINPDHLFLATAAENIADMVRKGRQHQGDRWKRDCARGVQNGSAKYSDAEIQAVRDLALAGVGQGAISRRTGISQPYISKVLSGSARIPAPGE